MAIACLGSVGTCILSIHTGLRFERKALKIAFPVLTVIALACGTWEPIWEGFNENFPAALEESALATIVEFFAVTASGISFYFLILRPRRLRGYMVLPAQVIAFGISMIALGL
jgi:hypothetical protein